MEDSKAASFPAGYESDSSSDDWFMECPPDKKIYDIQNADNTGTEKVNLLKSAIREGNVAAIEQLLDNGMDVESSLGFDCTPLMCAVSVADDNVAKVLLDRGANANFSKGGRTVLMASCTASAKEDKIARCVELLLSRNADPNMADTSQMTCLMLAAKDNYCKVLNLLASHGADLNMQNANGYTVCDIVAVPRACVRVTTVTFQALSVAVHHGREKAVLKLLQLGADSSIATTEGKSPAELALLLKHTQIARILSSALNVDPVLPFNSTKESLSTIVKSNTPSFAESVPKLDELELLLHGLDLDYLIDIMHDKDITWSKLLTMEEEDLEKVGITEPADQKKVLSALQQMHLDKLDLGTIEQLGATDSGCEELLNFLIKLKQQCCCLTETIQDTTRRLPLQVFKLVFTLDHKREAQDVCSQLMMQTKDLQTEVNCLHNLLCQMNKAPNSCRVPPPVARGERTLPAVVSVAAAALGVTLLFLSRGYLPKLGNIFTFL
ncbi:ankyrin repeat, SAM and basic leucine zipper domain-containing protein 1 isoform 1-T2 [Syngnathus typhle]